MVTAGMCVLTYLYILKYTIAQQRVDLDTISQWSNH